MDASRQLSLLDFHYTVPRVHKRDPVSSSVAIDKLEVSGALGRQARATLVLVRRYPGRTSKELAGLGSLDRYQLARRLPELRGAGVVKRTDEESECRWWPK